MGWNKLILMIIRQDVYFEIKHFYFQLFYWLVDFTKHKFFKTNIFIRCIIIAFIHILIVGIIIVKVSIFATVVVNAATIVIYIIQVIFLCRVFLTRQFAADSKVFFSFIRIYKPDEFFICGFINLLNKKNCLFYYLEKYFYSNVIYIFKKASWLLGLPCSSKLWMLLLYPVSLALLLFKWL